MGPLYWIDTLIGRPFLWLLKHLNRITGLSNLRLAQVALFIGTLVYCAGILAAYQVVVATDGPWRNTAVGAGIALLTAFGFTVIAELYSITTGWLKSYVYLGIVFTRVGLTLGSLSAIVMLPNYHDPITILVIVGVLTMTAGLYFLTNDRPKRFGWVGEVLTALLRRGGNQAPEASMNETKRVKTSRQ